VNDADSARDPSSAALDIGGRVFEVGAPGFSQAIAGAYATQRRPRCLCRPGGIEMYVARLGDGYLVKRMPESGNEHAPACPSFEPPAELSGLSRVMGSAITENPVSGETTLRLDFALSKEPGRLAQQRSVAGSGGASARAARLSLRGLLHYLWDEAELTRWHPGFEGKRSWATVRRHLLHAAEQKVASGNPLSARLYVPEPFSAVEQNQIRARQFASWSSAAVQPGGHQQLMLLIAEVKGIEPGRHGFHAVIKHVPDVAFALDEALYRGIGRRFAEELGVWGASENVRMIMGATFGLSAGGIPTIARLCLMTVTRQWLPVETMLEQQLVDQLVRDGRAFRKILRYDLPRGEKIASVALTDRGEPTPLIFAQTLAQEARSDMALAAERNGGGSAKTLA